MSPSNQNNESLTMGISQVGLSVTDIDSSSDFFQALGFSKIGGVESYPSYFLSDGHVMFTLWQADEGANCLDRRKNVGLHHLAIRVSSMEALQTAFEKIFEVEGVKVEFGPQEMKGTPLHHAMVYEPAGNRIELIENKQVANKFSRSNQNNESLTMGTSHVGLSVIDIDSSFAFFQALGFSKIGAVESYPSYFLSDGHVMLTLWQIDEEANSFDRRKNVGLHHLAIRISSMEALKTAFEKVSEVEGVKVEFAPQELKGTPFHHAMVYEPAGNMIELTFHST
jgi:lactoylglutathione lyase